MRQPAARSVPARDSRPMPALAAREAVEKRPNDIPRRATTKRSNAALANRRPRGMRMAPATVIRAPRTMVAFRMPPTNAGLACIHAVKRSSNGFTTWSSSSSGAFKVLPATAKALKVRFCCMMSCALVVELRAAASRAMLPLASLPFASANCRRSSSGLSTSLASVSLCSMPTSSTITPMRCDAGSLPMASSTVVNVPVASFDMPVCTASDDRPSSAIAD